jgi:hypothetical protein
MHQNQTRPPYLFSSKAPPISAPDVPDVYIGNPQSEPVTDKNNSASRKLLVMIAEEQSLHSVGKSSTVPEYFNKYKTGAKVHAVQFRMCYLPRNCRFNVTTTFNKTSPERTPQPQQDFSSSATTFSKALLYISTK